MPIELKLSGIQWQQKHPPTSDTKKKRQNKNLGHMYVRGSITGCVDRGFSRTHLQLNDCCSLHCTYGLGVMWRSLCDPCKDPPQDEHRNDNSY